MLVTIPYEPTPKQLELHDDSTRFKVAAWGRRSGKSTFAINEAIKVCLVKPKSKVWIVTPIFNQAKDIYWRGADMLNKYLLPIMYSKKNDSELLIEFKNGSILQFKGADRPEVMRGSALDLIVLDEVAEFRYAQETWESILLPSLSDKLGKAIFIGTPQGENFFYQLFLRGLEDEGLWKSWKIPTAESLNPWTLTVEGKMELERLKNEMSPQLYAQEYECDFSVPVQGAYYALQLTKALEEGRITKVPYNNRLLVRTAWDIGIGDSTAIWFFQIVGKEIWIIDYYEASNQGLSHYAEVLKSKGYLYEKHYMPFDAESREKGSGLSLKTQAEVLGIRPISIIERSDFDAGIEATRLLFNRFLFDQEKCRNGITALKNYRKEFDDKRGMYKSEALHDWSSHTADALRYLALSFKENTKRDLGFTRYTVPLSSITGF